MMSQTEEKEKRTELEVLTDDQRADIERLLMIVWKTKPANYSARHRCFNEECCPGEPEESLFYDFRQVCGL